MKMKSAMVLATVAGCAAAVTAEPTKQPKLTAGPEQVEVVGHVNKSMSDGVRPAGGETVVRYDNQSNGTVTGAFLPGAANFDDGFTAIIAADAVMADGPDELDELVFTVWNCADSDGDGFCDSGDTPPGGTEQPLGPTLQSVDAKAIFAADFDPGASQFFDILDEAGETVEIDLGTLDLTGLGGLLPSEGAIFTLSEIATDEDIMIPTEVAGDNPTLGGEYPPDVADQDLTFVGVQFTNPVTSDQGDTGVDVMLGDVGMFTSNQVQDTTLSDFSLDWFWYDEFGQAAFQGSTIANFMYGISGFGTTEPDCPPDLDGDGEVTSQDFLEFIDLFSAGDPGADFDDDGEITSNDFLTFIDAFAQGCP